ncbi:MAG: response regulator transcription factor [Candidatus Cohnella colombiensis]|uniref:Response regulator transcription factor n=1 Tax=Candidatus Cohnella colombiensis TaxID=3121368 RepID=A0AA95JBN2_9BACL|nr:MAG: response regulator transcription factor [Cohnella sp.]
MRKVILVDDEIFARKGLVGLIPWEKFGFEIVGEAKDGEEALSLIEQYKPDVVITDIRMPVLDGLQLIQAVRQSSGNTIKFIIISGYGDFKYAQQAVRYGVQDYLLKPIDENELIDTLQRIDQMLNNSPVRTEAEQFYIQASIFENFILGKEEEKMLSESAQLLGLSDDKSLRYVALEINDVPMSLSESQKIGQMEQLKETVSKVLKKYNQENEPFVSVRNAVEIGVLIHSEREPEQIRIWAEELIQASANLIIGVPKVYVGALSTNVTQVKASYASAKELKRYKFAMDKHSVTIYDDAKDTALHFKEIDPTLFSELMEQLEEHDYDAMLKLVDRVFTAFQEQGLALESITDSISRCVHGATRIIQTMHGDENQLVSLKPIRQWHHEPRTLEGVKKLLIDFLAECRAYIVELRSKIGNGDIGKIKSYIESHFDSNINLKSIAKHFYMNPVYVGQLFKKTYGLYFNEFLLQIRIQEAKRQLRQTNNKVYEIAANVGFGNADYFVCQFEKVEGKSPTEYKNAMFAKV